MNFVTLCYKYINNLFGVTGNECHPLFETSEYQFIVKILNLFLISKIKAGIETVSKWSSYYPRSLRSNLLSKWGGHTNMGAIQKVCHSKKIDIFDSLLQYQTFHLWSWTPSPFFISKRETNPELKTSWNKMWTLGPICAEICIFYKIKCII